MFNTGLGIVQIDGKQIFDSSSGGGGSSASSSVACLQYVCVREREAVNYRSCLGSFSALFDGLPASSERERAAVIGFSMKDHQQLPGGSADCSVAQLYQPSAPRR